MTPHLHHRPKRRMISPRAKKAQERSREAEAIIMDVAEALWNEHGYDEVSVQKICEQAGVAKGSFFFYFAHKGHLLMLLTVARLLVPDQVDDALASDASTADAIRSITKAIARRANRESKDLLRRGIEERYRLLGHMREAFGDRPIWGEILTPIIERGQARGEIPEHYDPAILSTSLSWLILNGLYHWTRLDNRRSVQRLVEARVELFLNGALACSAE